MPPRVPCPTCKREIEFSPASPWRPFCSERCRLIDLGAWLNEDRRIPGEPALSPDDEQGGERPDSASGTRGQRGDLDA